MAQLGRILYAEDLELRDVGPTFGKTDAIVEQVVRWFLDYLLKFGDATSL